MFRHLKVFGYLVVAVLLVPSTQVDAQLSPPWLTNNFGTPTTDQIDDQPAPLADASYTASPDLSSSQTAGGQAVTIPAGYENRCLTQISFLVNSSGITNPPDYSLYIYPFNPTTKTITDIDATYKIKTMTGAPSLPTDADTSSGYVRLTINVPCVAVDVGTTYLTFIQIDGSLSDGTYSFASASTIGDIQGGMFGLTMFNPHAVLSTVWSTQTTSESVAFTAYFEPLTPAALLSPPWLINGFGPPVGPTNDLANAPKPLSDASYPVVGRFGQAGTLAGGQLASIDNRYAGYCLKEFRFLVQAVNVRATTPFTLYIYPFDKTIRKITRATPIFTTSSTTGGPRLPAAIPSDGYQLVSVPVPCITFDVGKTYLTIIAFSTAITGGGYNFASTSTGSVKGGVYSLAQFNPLTPLAYQPAWSSVSSTNSVAFRAYFEAVASPPWVYNNFKAPTGNLNIALHAPKPLDASFYTPTPTSLLLGGVLRAAGQLFTVPETFESRCLTQLSFLLQSINIAKSPDYTFYIWPFNAEFGSLIGDQPAFKISSKTGGPQLPTTTKPDTYTLFTIPVPCIVLEEERSYLFFMTLCTSDPNSGYGVATAAGSVRGGKYAAFIHDPLNPTAFGNWQTDNSENSIAYTAYFKTLFSPPWDINLYTAPTSTALVVPQPLDFSQYTTPLALGPNYLAGGQVLSGYEKLVGYCLTQTNILTRPFNVVVPPSYTFYIYPFDKSTRKITSATPLFKISSATGAPKLPTTVPDGTFAQITINVPCVTLDPSKSHFYFVAFDTVTTNSGYFFATGTSGENGGIYGVTSFNANDPTTTSWESLGPPYSVAFASYYKAVASPPWLYNNFQAPTGSLNIAAQAPKPLGLTLYSSPGMIGQTILAAGQVVSLDSTFDKRCLTQISFLAKATSVTTAPSYSFYIYPFDKTSGKITDTVAVFKITSATGAPALPTATTYTLVTIPVNPCVSFKINKDYIAMISFSGALPNSGGYDFAHSATGLEGGAYYTTQAFNPSLTLTAQPTWSSVDPHLSVAFTAFFKLKTRREKRKLFGGTAQMMDDGGYEEEEDGDYDEEALEHLQEPGMLNTDLDEAT